MNKPFEKTESGGKGTLKIEDIRGFNYQPSDAYRGADISVTEPGTLHCIEPDGSMRPGHDIINRYL